MGELTAIQGAQLGGAVAGLGAAVSQAEAIRAQATFERSAIRRQQRLERLRARQVIERGQREELQKRQQVKKLIGAQRVALAAQGIVVDAGTAFAIQSESAALGALDAATIRNNAFREALGIRLGIEELGLRSRILRIAARAESRAAILGGVSGVVTATVPASRTRRPGAAGGALGGAAGAAAGIR